MNKKLRVWHIPQVPMEPFYVEVDSVDEALKIMRLLAEYDLFQYEHRVKPDYCSTQGLEEFDEEDQEWYEWDSDDYGDIHDYERSLEGEI